MAGQLAQIVGSLLILVPFGLAQLGFLLLEGAWAIVSAVSLVRAATGRSARPRC
jgi:hypothetical protein